MTSSDHSNPQATGASSPESHKAYIGFQDCGCPVAAMVAGYDTLRGERAELRRWTKDGYRIEVMDPDEARKLPNFLHCTHRKEGHRSTEVGELDELITKARGAS